MDTPDTLVFRGRGLESRELAGLLEKARAGESAAVVVRGDAGIGKTALLDHCVGDASDFAVARIAGAESEMELPFAGLHQLCAPMLADIERLPDPQQEALRVAFGLASGDAPDRFLVALATLSLLAEVALKRPLLCVIDDAQWLDEASAQVLAFVARRILAESMLMLFAVREPSEDRHLAGLPELVVGGLDDDDARALLASATPRRIDVHVLDRLVAETRGNPLAILELPKAMTAVELAGGFPGPHARDLSGQLEQHFLRRLEALPMETQRLILAAAADPTGNVALLWRAAQGLGIEAEASAAAGAQELVEFGARVQFRHPLVRSAVYSGASPADRRAVHTALAEATDPAVDRDRRAWHFALAAPGPDEDVASELEQLAGRAQSRGGLASAAAFLQRSVVLTRDPERRADRALAAAQAQVQAGAFSDARRLLATAEIDAQNELQRARLDLLQGHIAAAVGPFEDAPVRLLAAARRLEPLDIGLARETYLDALTVSMYTRERRSLSQVREVAAAALSAPESPNPALLTDLLLKGFALLICEGMAAARPTLVEALAAFYREELSVDKGLMWGLYTAVAAETLWDLQNGEQIYRRQSEVARRAGALAPLCFTLNGGAFLLVLRGDLSVAAGLIAEADALIDVIGLPQASVAGMALAAYIGDEPRGLSLIRAETDLARARGEGAGVQIGFWAEAVLANGRGRYEHALSMSRRANDAVVFEWTSAPWVLPELIEAAVRTGQDEVATGALEQLAESTASSEGDWGQGALARGQALVSDDRTAEQHYREAITRFERTPLKPDLARSRLLYGEWLRRQNRRTDARDQLRQAHNMFLEIGMLAFADRARNELRATGETVRKRLDETRDDLTPQEELIARLALDGHTNREIGAQLFLSPRTVEWHLRKVFIKLGVTSRRGLQDAMPARGAVSNNN